MAETSVFARISATLGVLFMAAALAASDPPDSALNSQSGYVETTDSTWQSGNYDVRHVIDPGQGSSPVVVSVTQNPANDVSPRIAISPAGETWVVWCREGTPDQVVFRKRTLSSSVWETEDVLSDGLTRSRNPEIAYDGTNPWVVFEVAFPSGDTEITVRAILDDPVPYGSPFVVSTTSYAGIVDALIHADAGHLWVTWVDSTVDVGWSQYDYALESWSLPQYESFAADTVDAARSRIEAGVLDPE